MITAEKLALLIRMPTVMLEQTLPAKDRPQLRSSRFVGITNGHEFCYTAQDHAGITVKVFVRYDPTRDQVFGEWV